MTIDKMEEKLKMDVWWVLQEIRKEYMVTPEDEYTNFEPKNDEIASEKDQRRALKFLIKEKVIRIAREKFPMNLGYTAHSLGWKPMSYLLELLQPVFDKTYKSYEGKFGHTETSTRSTPLLSKKGKDGITLGPISFKNNSIYYKDGILKLTPQAVKLCKLFIEEPDAYISDERIKEAISTGDFTTTENMQKIVSKLRTTLRKANKKINIQRIGNAGYRFIGKELR